MSFQIFANNLSRYSATSRITQEWISRYSNSPLFVNNLSRYSPTVNLQASNVSRYLSQSQAAASLALDPTPAATVIAAGFRVALIVNGTYHWLHGDYGLSPNAVKGFRIRQNRNEVVQWELEILDPLGQFSPHNETSPWFDLLNTQAFSGGSLDKTLFVEVTITTSAGTFVTPYNGLVILDRTYQANKSGMTFNLRGTDVVGRLLTLDDITLSSKISSLGNLQFASTIIKDILSFVGITNFSINFDDYPVRQLHVQAEKGIDIIKKIIEVNYAVWYSNGYTIFFNQPAIAPTQFDFFYQDSQNVFILDESESSPSLINQVTVTIPQISVISKAVVEGTEYTRYTANFDPPIFGTPQFQFEYSKGGTVTEMDCFGPNGEWVGHYDFTVGASTNEFGVPVGIEGVNFWTNIPSDIRQTVRFGSPVASVEFNYAPISTNTAFLAEGEVSAVPTKPSFRVVIYGRSQTRPDLLPFIPASLGNFSVPDGFVTTNVDYSNLINVSVQTAAAAALNPNNIVVNLGSVPSISDLDQFLKLGVVVTNQHLADLNGVRPATRPIPNMMIPNSAWAYRFGVQYLIDSARDLNKVSVTCPYNPSVTIGSRMQIVHKISGINNIYTVDGYEHTFATDKVISKFPTSLYDAGASA